MSLASALSDAFTLYVVNRRGRGGSNPFPPRLRPSTGYGRGCIERAGEQDRGVQHLRPQLGRHQRARRGASALRDLQKVAVYELPLLISQATPIR